MMTQTPRPHSSLLRETVAAAQPGKGADDNQDSPHPTPSASTSPRGGEEKRFARAAL